MASASSGVSSSTVDNAMHDVPDARQVWHQIDPTGSSKLYFWKLDDEFKQLPQAMGTQYVLFAPKKATNFSCLVRLTYFNNWRQVQAEEFPLAFTNDNESSVDARSMTGIGSTINLNTVLKFYVNGRLGVKKNTPAFQTMFAESMQTAMNPNSVDQRYWTRMDLDYYETETSTTTTRGVCFFLNSSSLSADPNASYIKLRPDDRFTNLVYIDDATNNAKADLYKNGIYIPEPTMNSLRNGTYNFKGTKNFIRVRNAAGEIVDMLCAQRNHNPAFWKRAYDIGTEKQESRGVRSRNPTDLPLLFIVRPRSGLMGPEITADRLRILVEQAKNGAEIPIRQVVEVVAAGREAEALKSVYNYRLGVSPFYVYETWIASTDYASFLTAYPDRPLPSVKDVQNALAQANRDPNISAEDQQVLRVQITDKTVLEANTPGIRSTVQSQGQVMGLSATEIAQAFKWADATERLQGHTVGTRTWDSPGVYPAEWLHRIALSYGHPNGYQANQHAANLIFGTSDANSLMQRYEKAWQGLFIREHYVRTIRFQILGEEQQAFKGDLITGNTLGSCPIFYRTLDAGGTTFKTSQLDGDTHTLYVACAKTYPSICFTLYYKLWTGRSYVLQLPSFMAETIFYPFQSGFFSRVEAETDSRILDYWMSLQINAVRNPGGALGKVMHKKAVVVKRPEAVDDLTKAMEKVSLVAPTAAT